MPASKVKVVGIGGSVTVEVEGENLSVKDILDAAGIDAESAGLATEVNGAEANGNTPVANGDTVTTAPREAKLG